jgi:hypothetical protein
MLVPLNSLEGTKRLEEASSENNGDRCGCDNISNNNDDTNSNSNGNNNNTSNNSFCSSAVQQHIIESFRKQRGNTVCGLASLAVLLTARKKSLETPTPTTTPTAAIPAIAARAKNTENEKTFGINENSNSNSNNSNHSNHSDICCFVDEDDVYPMVTTVAQEASIAVINNENNNAIAADSDSDAGTVIVSEENIRTSGMTLDQMRALAEALPTTEKVIAFSPAAIMAPVEEHNTKNTSNNRPSSSTTRTTLLEGPYQLRRLVSNALSEHPSSKQGLVLNYHMSTLGQVPFGGHLSPIAAYHPRSDSILVMDVWHTHTEPVWASVECVWKAILGTDPSSGLPRGVLKVVHHSS